MRQESATRRWPSDEGGIPDALKPSLGGAGRAATLWSFADQLLVSGANFLVGIILARGLGLHAFGAYVIVQVYLLYANTFQSALVVAPMLTSVAAIGDPYRQQRVLNGFFAYAVLVCAATVVGVQTLAFALGSWFTSLRLGELASPLCFVMVAFQVQDWLRRAFYARSMARQVLLADVVAYGGQLAALAALAGKGELTAASALWMMALTFGASAVFCTVAAKAWPNFTALKDVWSEHWKSSRDHLASWQAQWIASQGIIVIGTGVVGTQAAGAIRAAQNLLGPLNVLFQWMDNVLPVRAALHLRDGGTDSLRDYLARLNRVGLLGLFAFLGLLTLFDDWLIVNLYGAEYLPFASLVVFQGVYYLFTYAYRFDSYYMRAVGDTGALARASALWAIVSVAIALAAVAPLAERGIMLALVSGAAAALLYLRSMRQTSIATASKRSGIEPRFISIPRAGKKSWLIVPAHDVRLLRAAIDMYPPHRWTGRFYKSALGWVLPMAARWSLVGSSSLRDLNIQAVNAELESVPGYHASRIGILCSGTGPRAKWTIKIMDDNGRAVAYARASSQPDAVAALLREADLLSDVCMTAAAVHAPKVLDQRSFDAGRSFVLIESAGPTSMLPPVLSASHFDFLARLITSEQASVEEVITKLEADLERFRHCIPQWQDIERALSLLRERAVGTMPVCIEHGDFAPWNVRSQEDGSVFALDWEHGRPDGLPWFDVLHFGFQTDYLVRHCSSSEVLANMRTTFGNPAAEQYMQVLKSNRPDQQTFVLLYLLRALVLGASDGLHSNSELQRFRMKVLQRALGEEVAC